MGLCRSALARTKPSGVARRVTFAALLASTLALPHMSSSVLIFPGVSHFWALLPFGALMLLPFVARGRLGWRHLDLVVLLAVIAPIGLQSHTRLWPDTLIYPVFGYLVVRMLVVGRAGNRGSVTRRGGSLEPLVPLSWLLAGIAVLAVVHVSWALGSTVTTDVGQGSVAGALRIIHGHALYGPHQGPLGTDPHTDTYGPLNYEAYLPFAAVFDARTAAHLTTLFFDLLTALLLFVLGRRLRSPATGVVLAYCWLAFPLTLYEDALGFNDAVVAASVVGLVLAAGSPRRGGALAALAAWTKLSPLALVPLLLGYVRSGRRGYRGAGQFALGFALVTCVVFLPALAHSSPAMFLTRTFGYQSSRPPSGTLWDVLQFGYAHQAPWLEPTTKVVHGLVTAAVGAMIVMLYRVPGDTGTVALAAKSAAVLIGLEACTDYYAFSYALWFVPLVLVVSMVAGARSSPERSDARAHAEVGPPELAAAAAA